MFSVKYKKFSYLLNKMMVFLGHAHVNKNGQEMPIFKGARLAGFEQFLVLKVCFKSKQLSGVNNL